MRRSFFIGFAILNTFTLLSDSTANAETPAPGESYSLPVTSTTPNFMYAVHDAGNMTLTATNYGRWGESYLLTQDCFTGEVCGIGSEYPKGSLTLNLLHGTLWIGGVLKQDTLVSTGASVLSWRDRSTAEEAFNTNFRPDPAPFGAIEKRSLNDPTSAGSEEAVSNQDFIATYTDTGSSSSLNVEIAQESYAWSCGIADDFVLFDITIKNIGPETIHDAYVGILSRPEVSFAGTWAPDRWSISGFKQTGPSPLGCGITDTFNIMWGASNDGDPVLGEFTDKVLCLDEQECFKSSPDVHGNFFLDYPGGSQSQPTELSYNWWSFATFSESSFGPRHREDYREFRMSGTGMPATDAECYYIMRSGEIDYDMLYTASIGSTDPIWLPPPPEIAEILSTYGLLFAPYNLLSVGPFDISPGSSVKTPFAYVCGQNFHTDPYNAENLPNSPASFYTGLNFTDLIQNAMWAKWVYDNPGVDTDGDEYAGEFTICNDDTVYYAGDGVPDWRATLPPQPPVFWLEPIVNGLRIRFNGTVTETDEDIFSGEVDFEGYRVYCGRDERAGSMAMMASYDKQDYDKYVWIGSAVESKYIVLETPFTLNSLRCLYGVGDDPCNDTSFEPLTYTSAFPYRHPDYQDSLFYFMPHDHNTSTFGVATPIQKVYPVEPHPSVYHPDSIPSEAYTAEGYLKYYEYEISVEDLLPTVPYWINVTTFDFGLPSMNIRGQESSLTVGAKSAYPLGASDATAEGSANVYVYPNPYRGDAGYRDRGFEGRMEEDRPDYRVRAINFANLPAKCKIHIYSLDGDLVRKLDHDMDPSDPSSSHDTWDMITRNTQMVVTGLYYWVVEAEDGSTQMGRLAVIM